MSSLKKNLGYQTLYQLLNVGLPLITAPFLARKLGADQLGIMSFTTSIANYFVLFAMMGLTDYGTRSIAAIKENKDNQGRLFSEIYGMQLVTCLLSFLVYLGYLLLVCKENKLIAWIQMISIISCFLDINWFFFGIEAFSITVKRSIVIRACSVVLMLLLIRKPSDLWLYALILIGSTFVSQLVLWFYLPRYIKPTKVTIADIKKHFKPNLVLFIPLLAMSVYHMMDKTMLGVLSTYTQSGFYYNADKIINIPVSILSGIGTVMLPRMSSIASNDDNKKANDYFNQSICAIVVISSAMAFGVAAISSDFIPFFFGPGYDECINLVIVLAPILFVKGLTLTARYMYLIPQKQEKILTESVIVGALINLIVNYLLIPHIGAMGAVLGTLIAETVACIVQYALINKTTHSMKSIARCSVYLLAGLIMFILVMWISSVLCCNAMLKLLFEIIAGGSIYTAICITFWMATKNSLAISILGSFKHSKRK